MVLDQAQGIKDQKAEKHITRKKTQRSIPLHYIHIFLPNFLSF